jgi:hypothetical protein
MAIITLELLTGWGLWLVWGLAMLCAGWRLGVYKGRRRTPLASRHQGWTLADGWLPALKADRPSAQLWTTNHRRETPWPNGNDLP